MYLMELLKDHILDIIQQYLSLFKFVGFIEVCMGDGFRIVRDPAEGSFGPTQS